MVTRSREAYALQAQRRSPSRNCARLVHRRGRLFEVAGQRAARACATAQSARPKNSAVPQEPVQCAMELARALKNHPNIRLRMGVHSGPVDQVTDVNDRLNVAGAGINLAQRVMDRGDAGHILVSKRVADDLAQDSLWQSHLHELGEVEGKHGTKLGIVNLYTEEFGNSEVPQKFRQLGH